MARYGSVDPLPFDPQGPKPPMTFVITVETANPDIILRLKDMLGSTDPLDRDISGRLWETYVAITQVDENRVASKHIWSSAYEPDDEDE